MIEQKPSDRQMKRKKPQLESNAGLSYFLDANDINVKNRAGLVSGNSNTHQVLNTGTKQKQRSRKQLTVSAYEDMDDPYNHNNSVASAEELEAEMD